MNGESVSDRPGGRYSQSQDPGEIENRLSLNPSDPDFKDFVGNWQDGEEYTMTVTVRQVSPGEFEVTKAVPQDTPAEETGEAPAAADEGETASGDEPQGTDTYGNMNPAVARMMNKK